MRGSTGDPPRPPTLPLIPRGGNTHPRSLQSVNNNKQVNKLVSLSTERTPLEARLRRQAWVQLARVQHAYTDQIK